MFMSLSYCMCRDTRWEIFIITSDYFHILLSPVAFYSPILRILCAVFHFLQFYFVRFHISLFHFLSLFSLLIISGIDMSYTKSAKVQCSRNIRGFPLALMITRLERRWVSTGVRARNSNLEFLFHHYTSFCFHLFFYLISVHIFDVLRSNNYFQQSIL